MSSQKVQCFAGYHDTKYDHVWGVDYKYGVKLILLKGKPAIMQSFVTFYLLLYQIQSYVLYIKSWQGEIATCQSFTQQRHARLYCCLEFRFKLDLYCLLNNI